MSRRPRQLTEAGIYHIVTRGNNRQKLFRREKDYEFYLKLLERMKEDYKFEIYHYCLMTNHIHLLMRFYNAESLQKVMQRVNLRYAKYFRRECRYVGHVFQDRFKSFAIEKDSYLLECGRYIERNPLSAGMVQDLRDYRWSSYAYYGRGCYDKLLTVNPLYHDLGPNEKQKRECYQRYVLAQRPYEKFIDEAISGNNSHTRPSENQY